MTRLATLIGCLTVGSVGFAAEPRPDVPTVILQRTSCRGWCPVYSVMVTPDGMVQFEGREYVVKPGRHTRRISADDLARLKHAVEDADLIRVSHGYAVFGKPECEPVFDASSLTIAVINEADQVWVTTAYLCEKGATADELTRIFITFADTIDEIAGTSTWIGTDDQRRRHEWEP